MFAERGLDVPLEDIASAAGVSIGTLYNRFPTKGKLVDAALAGRVADMVRVAEDAAAITDPWTAFAVVLEGSCALQAADRGYNELCSRHFDDADEINALLARGAELLAEIIGRAQRAEMLRVDFSMADFGWLLGSIAQTVEDGEDVWRRRLGFLLKGLRAPGRLDT